MSEFRTDLVHTAYCAHCGRFVFYTVKTERVDEVFRGKKCHYKKDTAYCVLCGKELKLRDLSNKNRLLLCESYLYR